MGDEAVGREIPLTGRDEYGSVRGGSYAALEHGGKSVSKKDGVAIVVGSFHKVETEKMLSSAIAAMKERGLQLLTVVRVPGSYEKPLAVKRLLLRKEIQGVVVLGIIERGETAHGLVMGQSVGNALVQLQLEFMKPIGIGIIGPEVHPSQIPPRLHDHAVAAVAALDTMLRAEETDPSA
ncbi:6,7-dimethyl-8-ribityllumazine synthase [Telmatospirillum sp.]|uniref:6,7-dimethyl-8-ribityllumazine synthase n=1 Tax=Telmatospirillum sp. TaxID=2079197 RepID=UPI00284D8322|nr:6,7-dimethyl-8-ribityllumazine synthase [Telmatospirillum sp.]MDR3436778.1 6,7-dimethyl-8-ribityllumazine synthase [Telmatospirillum sp.]